MKLISAKLLLISFVDGAEFESFSESLNAIYNIPTHRTTTKLLSDHCDLLQKQRRRTEDAGHLLDAVSRPSVAGEVESEYMKPEATQPEATQPVYQIIISGLATDLMPGVPGRCFLRTRRKSDTVGVYFSKSADVGEYIHC